MQVLVTGATGTVGSQVVRELVARGVPVRAFVRDPGKAAAMHGDVEVAVGDLADRASLDRAMDGVDRVFLACGNVPGQVELECGAVDAARAAGVGRVVKLSAPRVAADSPVLFERWHAAIERHLAASAVPRVVLRPAFSMSNLLASAGTITGMGRMFLPAADAKVAMIHPGDVAAVAATVLTGDGHDERAYTLTGPEAITLHQAAEQLSAGLGRPVEYVDVPDEAAHAAMVQAGLPVPIAGEIIALWGELRRGILSTTTDVVRVLTGRDPRSVTDFARDVAPAFGA